MNATQQLNRDTIIAMLAIHFGKPGMKTRRAIDAEEVNQAIDAIECGKASKRVRVYSSVGFVPNGYRGRCEIQYVEAVLRDDKTWGFTVGWTGAQRSNGNGSLVVTA